MRIALVFTKLFSTFHARNLSIDNSITRVHTTFYNLKIKYLSFAKIVDSIFSYYLFLFFLVFQISITRRYATQSGYCGPLKIDFRTGSEQC